MHHKINKLKGSAHALKTAAAMLAVLSLGFVLSACGSRVESNVKVYHQLPLDYSRDTITVMSGKPDAPTSEFEAYAAKLNAKLAEAGFNVVEPTDRPRFVVLLHYAISDGQQVTRSYAIPPYGAAGNASTTTHGTTTHGTTTHGTPSAAGNHGTTSGTTYHRRGYGVSGNTSGTKTPTYYSRLVAIDIFEANWSDLATSKQVYRMLISSSGRCGALDQVFDEMLEAGFQNFPGFSGSSWAERVTATSDC